MGTVTILTISVQAIICYVDWVIGVGGLYADFERCISSVRDSGFTESLWDCIQAYGEQLAALTNDYYGCFY